jgi:predicted nucleotidyltransferase component of viral defense system
LHDAIRSMLDRYECRSRDDYVNALREILQDLALLGLWRSKFFEHAAFYGGTALRVLHGLDRYSEDLDFSLLKPNASFSLGAYGEALQREISSFGFRVTFTQGRKKQASAVDSAFLKANTYSQLIEIEAREELLRNLHPGRTLKIRLEVDTDPPLGFQTESQYVLLPVPFAVRAYCLPDLFAGKLHAVLCRKWKTRVKGRDWYDLVWYAGHHPEVRLSHLEARMRQSGDYRERDPMTPSTLQDRLLGAVDSLDVAKARQEVAPFVRDPRVLDIWSADFFRRIADRIVPI